MNILNERCAYMQFSLPLTASVLMYIFFEMYRNITIIIIVFIILSVSISRTIRPTWTVNNDLSLMSELLNERNTLNIN